MSGLKLKKESSLRRRFIKGPLLPILESWMDEDLKLKEALSSNSTFQLVGDKSVIQYDSKTKEAQLLVEVLGVPNPEFKSLDFEALDILKYSHPETVAEADFSRLLERARELKKAIPTATQDSFHIVFEGEKIALHFFIQKDYIDS